MRVEEGLRILVVDDHPIFRRGLRAVLEGLAWVQEVSEAASAEEAVRAAVVTRPDVVAMDLHLPDGNGIDVTRRLVAAVPSIAVLMLTMDATESRVAQALEVGARGYLVKSTDSDAVVNGLRAVALGSLILGPRVSVASLAAPPSGTPGLPPPLDQLTSREREVLAELATGRSNPEIGRRLHLSEKTVRNHLSSIFAKVRVTDRVQAALLARELGLGT